MTTRAGKSGTVTNFTLTMEDDSPMPDAMPVAAASKNLVLSGGQRSMVLASDWHNIMLKDSSTVTLTDEYPTSSALTVEYGSRINFVTGDMLSSWDGFGVVCYGGVDHHNHDWGPNTNTCIFCGASRYIVYVDSMKEYPGSGYSADTAVRTLNVN